MRIRTPNLALALALAATAVAPAAVAGGGTVVKLDGAVVIERKSLKVHVERSTPLYSGDILNVADRASAQVRFEDDSVFVLPGAARFRVDQFMVPEGGKGGTAFFTLLDGGLRTLTGRVGRAGNGQYELRTEEATITVAGSAYMALRCQNVCAKRYKPGLYVKGEEGAILINNAAGRLKLNRGQTAYVGSNATLPVHVKVSPFNDPVIAAGYNFAVEFDAEVHPPRIEQEPPASPS